MLKASKPKRTTAMWVAYPLHGEFVPLGDSSDALVQLQEIRSPPWSLGPTLDFLQLQVLAFHDWKLLFR